MSDVEKVARAICDHYGGDPDMTCADGENIWPLWAEYEKCAKSAINAHLKAIEERGMVVVQKESYQDVLGLPTVPEKYYWDEICANSDK